MNLVMFGPPGAGKGTLAASLSRETGMIHISTGEIFREAIRNETELGKRVQRITESGALVPDELTIELVAARLRKDDVRNGVILDGFPRTIPQAEALRKLCEIDHVVNLRVPDEVVVERLSGRRVCSSCGTVFHIKFMPPKKEGVCDACGGELYQRKDDTVDAVKKRLEVYKNQTQELIEYFKKRDLLVEIDGTPKAETVLRNLRNRLDV